MLTAVKIVILAVVVAVTSMFTGPKAFFRDLLSSRTSHVSVVDAHDAAQSAVPQKRGWWHDAVVYQIYVRSFQDSNGDGIGDIRGIIQRLDYLNDGTSKSLGVDAIWLTPFYPSPQKDFGYDVADYRGVDPAYGTMEDFDELVRECQKRGIRVVLDLVVNHSSDQHPWFVESRSSLQNPKRDWYIWRDGKNGAPPTAWKSRMGGGSSWTQDHGTGQYYLHSFLKEQPDLNWRNPDVKKEIKDIMRFWLQKGIGGFRFDVFNYFYKSEDFRENPSKLSVTRFFYDYDGQYHVYDKDRPELFDLMKELREVTEPYNALLLGEADSDENTKNAARYSGGARSGGFDLVFNHDLILNLPFDAAAFRNTILTWEKEAPEGAQPAYAFGNHDFTRLVSRYGGEIEKARLIAMLMMSIRGTPVMYYGDEIGMLEAELRREEVLDPLGKKMWASFLGKILFQGRDGCRTPMQWSGEKNAGFSDAKPWFLLSSQIEERNVQAQREDPASLLSLYRELIALRKNLPALTLGSQQMLSCSDSILCYVRSYQGKQVLVLLNFSSSEQSVVVNAPEKWRLLTSSQTASQAGELSPSLRLQPFEGVMLTSD